MSVAVSHIWSIQAFAGLAKWFRSSSQSGKGRRSAGAVCGEALLEAVLAAHETAEAAIPRAFPPLLVRCPR